jgi:hypothetical protein
MITATYGVNIVKIYYKGTSGYLLCLILSGEQLMWFGLNSSAVNLVSITVERYVKIVHSIWHKNHFKRWMVYFGCAFSWVSGPVANFICYPLATYVSDGQCMPLVQFPSRTVEMVYVWFTYLYYYQVPLLIFVICYARIFQVIRRQNRIFQQAFKDEEAVASSSAGGAIGDNRKSWQSQVNAAKTMIIITLFFAISWMPSNVYYVIVMTASASIIQPIWYAAVFIALFNICANPFIYIVSNNEIRVCLTRNLAAVGLLQVFRTRAVGVTRVFTLSEQVQTGTVTR